MTEVQRRQYARLDVARPVEIEVRTDAPRVSGYTRNLSETGIAARVDHSLPVGQLCLVQITLADEERPTDTCAEIVWCRKDIYGSGAEVGLRLLAPEELAADPRPQTEEALRVPAGATVQISYDGHVFDARVAQESRLRGETGGAELRLVITGAASLSGVSDEAAPPLETDAELLAAAEEWKPKPIEEAWLALRRFTLPVLVVLLAMARPTWRLLKRGLAAAWARVPTQHRDRAAGQWARLALARRAAWMGNRAQLLARTVVDEVRTRRTALVRRGVKATAAARR